MSSQTSNPPSTADLHQNSNMETNIYSLMHDSSTQVLTTTANYLPVLLTKEEYNEENTVIVCGDAKFGDDLKEDAYLTPIEEETNVNDEVMYECMRTDKGMYNEPTGDLSETLVCDEETCPIEIDVIQCLSTEDRKESSEFETESEKYLNISNIKHNVTVLDVVSPSPLSAGSGECEDSTCKGNPSRRIPQYQGLRKGAEHNPRTPRDHDSVEDRTPFVIHQKLATPVVPEVPKSSRANTPRKYSSTPPEVVDTAKPSGRRRRQRN